MSKELPAQLIGTAILPKPSPRTPNSTRNTKSAGLNHSSSSFSRVISQRSNYPPVRTANSTRGHVASLYSPRNISFGTATYAAELGLMRPGSTCKKTTVDYLLMHQPQKPERLSEGHTQSVQFMKTFDECKDLSSAQETKRQNLEKIVDRNWEMNLFQSISSAFQSFTHETLHAEYFIGESKKDVLKTLVYIENLFFKLGDHMYKLIDEKNTKIKSLEAICEKFDENSKILGQTSSELKEIKGKNDSIAKKNAEEAIYFEIRERAWNKEKAQLENRIEMLMEKLEGYKDVKSNDDLKSELFRHATILEENIVEYKKKIESLKNVISKLQLDLGLAKTEINDKMAFFNEFSEIKRGLEAVIEEHKENEIALENKIDWLKEIIYMQNEDLGVYKKYRYKYQQLKITHNTIVQKLHSLEMNIMLGNFHNAGQNGDTIISLKDPIFSCVREPVAFERGYFRRTTNKEFSTIPENTSRSESPLKKESSAKQKFKREVSLDGLIELVKHNRPTYASLISIPTGNTATFAPPFEDWLEITIRGIFDSKYYEHLMCSKETGRIPSKFPEFVYAWLGSFYVDEKSRTVKELEWHKKDHANEFRLNILLGLCAKPSNKIWEIFTFKEFLLEDLGIDELAFFLHCRFALFGGPQLCQSSGRCANFHYLAFEKVSSVVDMLMANLPSSSITELKNILKQKCGGQNGALTIEASLVLRVMLEYYRNEKSFKIQVINDLFEQNARENEQAPMNFENFKYLVKNIDLQIPESRIAKLFRDSWAIGNSKITAASFLAAANESGFFFHHLRLKGIYSKPATDQYGIIDPNADAFSSFWYKIESSWKSMNKDIEMVKLIVGEMGVPDLSVNLSKLEMILNRKGTVSKEDNGNWHIGDIFSHYWYMVIQIELALNECGYFKYNLKSDRDSREREIIEITLGCQSFIKKLYDMNLQRVSTKIKLRRVQKKFKDIIKDKQNRIVDGIFKEMGKLQKNGKMSLAALLAKRH